MPHGILSFTQPPARQAAAVVNGRFLAKPNSGVSRVGIELLRALGEEIAEAGLPLRLRVATPPEAQLDATRAALAFERTRGFATNLGVQLALPLLYRGATVISFCNETPLMAAGSVIWIHDTNVFDAPESYPRAYRMWHRLILETAKLRGFEVATVSACARARLIAHGLLPAKIRVIYNGGDHILREAEDTRALQSHGLAGKDFILVVGSPARHKNVPFAVQSLLPLCSAKLQVAVLGMSQVGPYAGTPSFAQDPRVTILPRVRDGELRALYRAARVVLSPSLCEGFGLYVAEAMFAESGPLVLSQRGALPEVAGDAALYFDPRDPGSLRDAVQLALQPDSQRTLANAARSRRELFRWRRAARQVLESYFS